MLHVPGRQQRAFAAHPTHLAGLVAISAVIGLGVLNSVRGAQGGGPVVVALALSASGIGLRGSITHLGHTLLGLALAFLLPALLPAVMRSRLAMPDPPVSYWLTGLVCLLLVSCVAGTLIWLGTVLGRRPR